MTRYSVASGVRWKVMARRERDARTSTPRPERSCQTGSSCSRNPCSNSSTRSSPTLRTIATVSTATLPPRSGGRAPGHRQPGACDAENAVASGRLATAIGLLQPPARVECERGSLRVTQDCEASTRIVLRREHLLASKADRLLERGVDVVGLEVHRPVARNFRRDVGWHLEGAGDALAVNLELGVLLTLAERAGLVRPAKDRLVKRDRALEAARVQLGPGERGRFARQEVAHPSRLTGRPAG